MKSEELQSLTSFEGNLWTLWTGLKPDLGEQMHKYFLPRYNWQEEVEFWTRFQQAENLLVQPWNYDGQDKQDNNNYTFLFLLA